MNVRSIHPFPARMAPDLALVALHDLPRGSTVLDPMVGSGTVVRHALEFGHQAIGYDLDPLAVLMSRAWTIGAADDDIVAMLKKVLGLAAGTNVPDLPWQADTETGAFVNYWFHEAQRGDLARIAAAFAAVDAGSRTPQDAAALDILKVAFSRIIITKEQCASLARDTSHSRPHRVTTVSDYRVMPNFERSVAQLRKRLLDAPPKGRATIERGDARAMPVEPATVDAIITSPPYLNAIDYMRGHRMSLVWLGHTIPELRRLRSASIGAERAADQGDRGSPVSDVVIAMRGEEVLSGRLERIVDRYALDLVRMTGEIERVLKPGGRATLVVGNSCVKGRFVDNATGVAVAAGRVGLSVVSRRERDLPPANRYLPISGDNLSKRMRTETVLVCRKVA